MFIRVESGAGTPARKLGSLLETALDDLYLSR
jgi:hypothetical protein